MLWEDTKYESTMSSATMTACGVTARLHHSESYVSAEMLLPCDHKIRIEKHTCDPAMAREDIERIVVRIMDALTK
jgi:hypothetical protein